MLEQRAAQRSMITIKITGSKTTIKTLGRRRPLVAREALDPTAAISTLARRHFLPLTKSYQKSKILKDS